MPYPKAKPEDLLEPPFDALAADELADLFSEQMNSALPYRAGEKRAIQTAALFIAETAGRAAWQALDPEEFAEAIRPLSVQEQGEITFVVAGFYVWLGLMGAMDRQRALSILDRLQHCAPKNQNIDGLIRSGRDAITSARIAMA
ncbi:MAG: hypothetical protein AAF500_14135 [Myxococcota bacterium]